MKIYTLATILLMAFLFIGCKNNQKTEKEEHAHDEKLQLTTYNEDFELFAEVTPFVVGHQSDILAHFSFLKNFKPLTQGKVTISLVIGSDKIEQVLEQATKPGIFLFQLTPTIAGTGKLIFDIESSDGQSQIVIPDIKVYANEEEAQHEAAKAAITSNNGVVFTKEQSWKIDFGTEQVKKEPFGQGIKTIAQILPSQGDERVITAKASGIVLFATQNLVEGKTVSARQTLFSIESSDLADNNLNVRLSEAASEYNRAKTEYERKKELASDKIISESELLKAQTEFKNAEVVYTNLRKNFSSGKQIVNSPISGFVKQMLIKNGEYAETGQPIAIISQNNELLIKAELQPKYYPLLVNITSANIRLLNSNSTYSIEELGGKVISYGKSSDLDNPLIPVIFQVKNSINLLPGSFVELFIKTLTNNQAITVPNESIIEEMGNYFVFVQLTPELFEKRMVTKGVTDGFRTEIIDGVTDQDRIVSKGAMLVKLAQSSNTLDAHSGHAH